MKSKRLRMGEAFVDEDGDIYIMSDHVEGGRKLAISIRDSSTLLRGRTVLFEGNEPVRRVKCKLEMLK